MKKLAALLLTLLLILSLAACGGDKTPASETQPADSSGNDADPTGPTDNDSLGGLADLMDGDGAWFNEDASGEDLFARHGFTDIIPEGTTYIRRWMEDPITDVFVRTEYTFEIPQEPTPEERQEYYNHVLSQIRAAADDGKVYKWCWDYDAETDETDTWWEEMPDISEAMEYGLLSCSYYHDGALWDVMCSDGDFDDYYVYTLNVTTNYHDADAVLP